MKKIMLAFGTRPDAVKMCPLVLELKRREGFEVKVCLTGQHREMLDSVMDTFGVRADCDLSVMREGQSLAEMTSRILGGMTEILRRERPDILLVHGDTSSAFSAALAAFYLGIPVGHVEAGLRTYDMTSPFPEEFNRRAVSLLSTVDFAPTEAARDRLIAEGKSPERVFVTGNTVIDALKYTAIDEACDGKTVLLTAHRRENLGEAMDNIFSAVRRIAEKYPDLKIVYPMHPNPAVRKAAEKILGGAENVELREPLGLREFHSLLARAVAVMTDSGGVQEEAAALGKPCLVLRDTTERRESESLILVGTREDEIVSAFERLIDDKEYYDSIKNAPNPYGDGKASERIADILERI